MAGASEVFTILVVCTGNVCRSPLAERLLRARLANRLGPAARQVRVHSAGTAALAGHPMDPSAAERLRFLGGDDTGFVARVVTAEHLADADLILTMTRRHRAAVARVLPQTMRRTFTLREFARLAAAVDPARVPADGDIPGRLRAAVGQTRAPGGARMRF